MHEARYYETLTESRVHCELCPHQCIIKNGQYGRCRVRRNEDGKLIAESYGFITSAGFDPIEKKPLMHYMSGKTVFSIGSKGCSFSCGFCQNHAIALGNLQGKNTSIEHLLELMKGREDNIGIAFTYNEPMVNYEFMLDMAKAAKAAGFCTVCVSNGFIMPDPLDELLPYIDAFNIDLKGFSDRFYHEVCRGERAPVMEAIQHIAIQTHLELTFLLIEGENDDPKELEAMFSWIKDIKPDIPLHISRYFPRHKYEKPPTSIEALKAAEALAKKYLKHVHLGNVSAEEL